MSNLPKGTARYVQELDFPIESVWGLLKNFKSWGVWSPFYLNVKEISNSGQVIQRQYDSLLYDSTVTKPTIEETSVIDDTNHILKYHSVQNSNPNIHSVNYTITLTPKPTSKSFELVWEAVSDLGIINDVADFIAEAYTNIFGEKGSHECPYAKLAATQTRIFQQNVFGITLNLMLASFKNKAFEVFNEKLVALEGQALLGNSDQTGQYQYRQYEVNTENMPKKVAGIPLGEVLPPQKFSLILKRLLEMSYVTVSSFFGGYAGKFNADLAAKTLAHMYGSKQDIKMTDLLLEKWQNDDELAQQLLQGVNPMMIAKVSDFKKQVPVTMQGLKVEENGKETGVEALAQQGRLFIVDYEDLHGLPIKNPEMTFYAPYLLVYKELLANNESRLNIVGIQLERQPDVAAPKVYTPKSPKNLWTLAKMFVQSADNQCHEFRYHLGQAHLCQEPVVIATHNRLPKTHVIRSLLQPHLEETIGINFLARQTLISPTLPFTDRTFVVGTANGIRLAGKAWEHYDFFGSSFPEQLKSRGFDEKKTDGLDNYWYREDGFQLWNIIGNYTTNVVNSAYSSDKEVLADAAVQAWAAEMQDPARANMKGFPKAIETRKLLAHVTQIIIWNGAALHSVVNFPQWPYLGFIKNRPNGLYTPMPKFADDKQDITEADIDKALLPTPQSLFQILFSWLLSANAEDTTLPHLKAVNGKVSDEFQAELRGLTERINARNAKLEAQGKIPYVYCLPENIACSVNI